LGSNSKSSGASANVRAALAIIVVSTLAGAYALGSQHRSGISDDADLSSIESFRASLTTADALQRSHRFNRFVQGLRPENVEATAEIIEERRFWLADDELRNFMIAWTRFDAPAALDWAASRRSEFSARARAAGIYSLAFHDPQAGLEALESLDPSVRSPQVEEAFFAGWLQSGSHQGVVDYITSQADASVRQKFTNLLTIELARDGPEAVIRWAESIPEDASDGYKGVAFDNAGNITASVDPVLAAGWIERHLEHEYSARTPAVIAMRWVALDPPSALAWLASLPAGSPRDSAMVSNFQRWWSTDAPDAERWLQAIAPADGVDVAIGLMIREAGDQPWAAMDWANRIHDRTERPRALLTLGRRWMRKDPDAVQQWLETSELQGKLKQAILHPPIGERKLPVDVPVAADPGANS
jgi:hypothetical protein